jgi:hypothetical protein
MSVGSGVIMRGNLVDVTTRVMSLRIVLPAWCVVIATSGCIHHHDSAAKRVAEMTARYEFDCDDVTAEQIARLTTATFAAQHDDFKFGVRGCGKSDVYAVRCGLDESSGCDLKDAERVKTKHVD